MTAANIIPGHDLSGRKLTRVPGHQDYYYMKYFMMNIFVIDCVVRCCPTCTYYLYGWCFRQIGTYKAHVVDSKAFAFLSRDAATKILSQACSVAQPWSFADSIVHRALWKP